MKNRFPYGGGFFVKDLNEISLILLKISKVMKSERMLFEHYSESDFDTYFNLVNNVEIMRMILGRPLLEDEARDRFKNMLHINKNSFKIGHFKISDKLTGQNIGQAKLEMTEVNQAEIGYLLSPEYWRKGYGAEIAQALVKLSNEIPDIYSLIAIIDPENVASKRILEKQLFQRDYEGQYYGLPAVYYKLELSKDA